MLYDSMPLQLEALQPEPSACISMEVTLVWISPPRRLILLLDFLMDGCLSQLLGIPLFLALLAFWMKTSWLFHPLCWVITRAGTGRGTSTDQMLGCPLRVMKTLMLWMFLPMAIFIYPPWEISQ